MSTIVIGELELTEISALVSSAESCEGGDGTITVIPESITEGTQYSLDGFNFQTDSVFHGLSSGQYTVQSIDINGCIDEATVDVSQTAPFTITSLVAVSAQCDQPDGSVTIESDRPVNVMVNNIFSGTAPGTIGSLAAGTYVIEFSDANNCKLDTTIDITKENCGIFVPNVFSPNGDGSNDEFGPVVDINRYNIKAFNVYNRWGMAVFDCYGDCEWDGTNDGKASPAGVYVYYLLIEDKTGELLHYSGDITLVR